MIDLEVTLFLCLLTSERGPFRALKMRPVRQEAVHSLWSRLFCGPLKMRRVPEKAVFGTEYLFRTVEACFLHRMLPKMRRVPQEAFLSTARIFRTIGGPLRYRMPDRGRLPPQRSLAYILVDLSLCYRPHCSVDKPFTGTCGGGFMQWCSTGRPHYL